MDKIDSITFPVEPCWYHKFDSSFGKFIRLLLSEKDCLLVSFWKIKYNIIAKTLTLMPQKTACPIWLNSESRYPVGMIHETNPKKNFIA